MYIRWNVQMSAVFVFVFLYPEYWDILYFMTMKYTAKQMAGSCPTVRTVSVKKYQMSL